MLHRNHHSLLAVLLIGTLAAVQTALPWMHVGCQHDHSIAQADGPGHHHCRGHHHSHAPAGPEAGSTPLVDHTQQRLLAEDCAACRFLLLSSVACESTTVCLIEHVALLPRALPIVAATSEPVRLYRSRAPPALS